MSKRSEQPNAYGSLYTIQEAMTRTNELLASFAKDPDILSPDEQALAVALMAVCESRMKVNAEA